MLVYGRIYFIGWPYLILLVELGGDQDSLEYEFLILNSRKKMGFLGY